MPLCYKRPLSDRHPPPAMTIGSVSIDDGDGSEKVTFKMNSRFFKLCRVYSNSMQINVKCGRISLELISWRPYSSLERERKLRNRLFTFPLIVK